MDETEIVEVSAALLLIRSAMKRKEKKRNRSLWMRSFLSERAASKNLTGELMLDNYLFQNSTRMSKNDFEVLINKIGPRIGRTDTNMRDCIPITTRLAITLRFRATGDSYRSLMFLFKVHFSSICLIVPEVCNAFIEELREFIKVEENDKRETPEIEGHFLVGLQTDSPDTSKFLGVPTLDKTSWSDDEKEVIMRYFHTNIEMKQVPRKEECETFLQREPVLCKRTWKDVKFCVYNLIKQNKEVAVSVCVDKKSTGQSHSYSREQTNSFDTSKLNNKSSVVSLPKTIWTDEEMEAIKRHFQWNIKMKKVPGKFECESCLKNEPVLSNKTWKTMKFCVFNLIKKK